MHVFYGFNFVVKLNYSSLHQISLIKILFLKYAVVHSSYTFERLLSYSSIIQALHRKVADMNLITDAYNYCILMEKFFFKSHLKYNCNWITAIVICILITFPDKYM